MTRIREVLDAAEESVLVAEPGDYLTEVESAEDHRSRTEGDCLKVHLRVSDGPQKGRLIVAILSKAPQAAFRILQLAEACQKDPNTIEDSDELVGCRVRVRLGKDTYQGEERLKVRSFAKAE